MHETIFLKYVEQNLFMSNLFRILIDLNKSKLLEHEHSAD